MTTSLFKAAIFFLLAIHYAESEIVGNYRPVTIYRALPTFIYLASSKISLPTGWLSTPELWATFDLREAQRITIAYSLSLYISNRGYLSTRLLINGFEHEDFRRVSSRQIEVTNSARDQVWLDRGRYSISLQYNTNGKIENAPFGADRFKSFLKIEFIDI